MAAAPNLQTLNNLEELVRTIVAGAGRGMRDLSPTYHVKTETDNEMLSWVPHTEIQQIPNGLYRIGAIGDGNCMLHSLLTAMSPTYRRHYKTNRQYIADEWRKILVRRMEELKELADVFYFDIGGAAAIEDSFEIIPKKRSELSLEIGLLIARLYGHNFLAVQLDTELNIKPACQTRIQYDPELPTVLINYMGGGLNFGNVNFQESGHYEVIIRTSMEGLDTTKPVELNEARTSYTPRGEEMASILELFDTVCGNMKGGRRSTRKVARRRSRKIHRRKIRA